LLKDYDGVNGTVTFAPGTTTQTISVPIYGDVRDEADQEAFFVDLSNQKNGGVVNPNGISAGHATGTILDDDRAPTISVSAPATINEGNGGTTQAAFTLTLSEVSERALSLNFATRDGTAVSTVARPDFTAVNQPVTYVAGSPKTITVSVPINGDTVDEANETFSVILSNPNQVRISDGTATATITDDDNSPGITVNSVSIVEGDSGTKDMVFTVSLLAASDQVVTVKFDTADGTGATGAVSTGPLADFIAQSGTLTFQPGETSKEVRVPILGDTYKETTTATVLGDQFTLVLSAATNGTIVLGAGTGTGTILADGDSVVGIGISDAFSVEGTPTSIGTNTKTMTFTVELSDTLTANTTVTVVTRSGTALSGLDFTALTSQLVFTAGQTSKPVNVTLVGDQVFEPTESFFVDLRDVPATLQVGDGTGRGTIFNDDMRQVNARTVQYIDFDGDLVTVHVSKGSLSTGVGGDFTFGAVNEKTGGRDLQNINLADDGREFRNTNLSITASPQAGFQGDANGAHADGRVNVGSITAATFNGVTQLESGIDLGRVVVEGDLGKIDAGDVFATAAIQSLSVQSLGRLGTNASTVLRSTVLSTIKDLHVAGVFAGSLRVIGERFGTIDHLFIGGGLVGGDADESGSIFFTGKINSGFIKTIVGGDGAGSGSIQTLGKTAGGITSLRVEGAIRGGGTATIGNTLGNGNSGQIFVTHIGSLRVGGIEGGVGQQSGLIGATTSLNRLVVDDDVTGGSGVNSGFIFGGRIGSVVIGGQLRGAGDATHGNSGSVASNSTIASVFINGGIVGGAGETSGAITAGGVIRSANVGSITGSSGKSSGTIQAGIQIGGGIGSLIVNGNIKGGTGASSGGVSANGTLTKATIAGSIIGGNSTGTASLVLSGYVSAGAITNLFLNDDLIAGENNGTALAGSGTIRSDTNIGTVRIHGNVKGSAEVAAIIAAPGTTTNRTAIQSLQIDGTAEFAEILAGYDANVTAANLRGGAVNADARIGSVRIIGGIQTTSIVAGADAGTDGVFGTNDDRVIAGSGVTDVANVYSQIANIVVSGVIKNGATSAGIIAQHVVAVSANGTSVPLHPFPGSDGDRSVELAAGTKIRVFELPIPA
jgi:hypothetical protein